MSYVVIQKGRSSFRMTAPKTKPRLAHNLPGPVAPHLTTPGLACHTVARPAKPNLASPRQTEPCPALPDPAPPSLPHLALPSLPRLTQPRRAIPSQTQPCRAAPSPAMPSRVAPNLAMPLRACLVWPHRTQPYSAAPSLACPVAPSLACTAPGRTSPGLTTPAAPRPTQPRLATPCLTTPCPASPLRRFRQHLPMESGQPFQHHVNLCFKSQRRRNLASPLEARRCPLAFLHQRLTRHHGIVL